MTFKKSSSLNGFRTPALDEAQIIRRQMEPYIGDSHYPFAPFRNSLRRTCTGNKRQMAIRMKIRSFPDKYETIEYVLPEILTEYLMEINTLNNKDAAKELYGGVLPTAHHVNMVGIERNFNQEEGGGGG